MITTFKLNTNEIDLDFLEAIRKIFKNQEIEMTIKKISHSYSQKILDAKENVEVKEKTVTYTVSEFEEIAKKLEEK